MAYASGSSGQMTSGALDKTEAHKALHWTARCCASLECDMFDDKKLAQEDNKSPCANALSQVTNTI